MKSKKNTIRSSERGELIRHLASLPEKELRDEVVEPLLRQMPFLGVTPTHGADELGSDFVCKERDAFGHIHYVGVQVKCVKLTAKMASKSSIYAMLNQLEQALTEPFYDEREHAERVLDRATLITPYPVSRSAWARTKAKASGTFRERLAVIDGQHLLDLIADTCPQIFSNIDAPYFRDTSPTLKQYLLFHHEAPAFRFRNALTLDKLFVRVQLRPSSRLLPLVLSGRISVRKSCDNALLNTKEYRALDALLASLLPKRTRNRICRPHLGVTRSRSRSGSTVHHNTWLMKTNALLSAIRRKLKEYPEKLRAAVGRGNAGVRSLQITLRKFNAALKTSGKLFSEPCIRGQFDGLDSVADRALAAKHSVTLPYGLLPKLPSPIIVLGGPGSGKTTLLKKLAHEVISDSSSFCVYYPLKEYRGASHDLVTQMAQWLTQLALPLSKTELTAFWRKKTSFVFLDGLDEIACDRNGVLSSVRFLSRTLPKVTWILSSRHAPPLSNGALGWTSLELMPFDKAAMADFFRAYFADDPENFRIALHHLCRFPNIAKNCTSPLMASILAGLVDSHVPLPRSTVDFYERRLALLLEEWDAVKRVARTQYDPRLKLFLVKKVAYAMHSNRKRAITHDRLLEIFTEHCRYHIDMELLTREIVDTNGLLIRTERDRYDFGHLSYQEHLAALQLIDEDPGVAAKKVGDSWWENVLRFYAARRLDLTWFFNYCKEHDILEENRDQLFELYRLAVLTRTEARLFTEANVRQDVDEIDDAESLLNELSIPDDDETAEEAVERSLSEDPIAGDMFRAYNVRLGTLKRF